MQNKNKQELQEFGGLSGLEEALRTSTSSGIDTQGAANLSANNRQKHFGANKFKDVPQKAFFTLFWENLKDPTLILLMAAALVRHMHHVCILLSCSGLILAHSCNNISLLAFYAHMSIAKMPCLRDLHASTHACSVVAVAVAVVVVVVVVVMHCDTPQDHLHRCLQS